MNEEAKQHDRERQNTDYQHGLGGEHRYALSSCHPILGFEALLPNLDPFSPVRFPSAFVETRGRQMQQIARHLIHVLEAQRRRNPAYPHRKKANHDANN